MNATRARDLLSRRFDTKGTAPVTHYVSQRLGSVFAALAFRLNVSPNAVTLAGFVLALVGSAMYAVADSTAALIVTAIIWQVAFALDCADGQLARATARQSVFGGWLDTACDFTRLASFGMAYHFAVVQQAPSLNLWATLAVFIFLGGYAPYLHTASILHLVTAPQMQLSGGRKLARTALRSVFDLPLILLVVCLLREQPIPLLIFLTLFGLVSGIRAVAIARLRLAHSTHAVS